MSWLERSRARIVHSPTSLDSTLAELAVAAPPGSATTSPSPPSGEPDHEVGAAPAGAPLEDRGTDEDSELWRYLPTITPGRAGRYSVTDESGRQIGVIYGDYVVGFTVSCWSLHSRYADMDAVMIALAREARSRAAAGLADAS